MENPHEPGPGVWELRRTRTKKHKSNVSNETQRTFQVDFYTISHPENTGVWFIRSGEEHTPGTVGPPVERSSNLVLCLPCRQLP